MNIFWGTCASTEILQKVTCSIADKVGHGRPDKKNPHATAVRLFHAKAGFLCYQNFFLLLLQAHGQLHLQRKKHVQCRDACLALARDNLQLLDN